MKVVFHNQIELTCNGVYLICLSMNFFEEGFLFVRTERPDYTTGMSILNSIHEGDSFSAENLWKRVFHCQYDWSSHGPAGQSPVQTFVKRPKKRPKAGSLRELSYVIKNVFCKRKYLKEFKSRAFQTTWIERFEAFLATCSLDPDLDLCFVQTWIEY